jgi:hypothetical protein
MSLPEQLASRVVLVLPRIASPEVLLLQREPKEDTPEHPKADLYHRGK